MQRTIRGLALGAAVFALAACSHQHNSNPMLSYVPANTPYVLANLKPITKDISAGLRPPGMTRVSLSMNIMQLNNAADDLDKSGKPHLANVARTIADSLKGKSFMQAEAMLGFNPDGMFAIYGLGLSPVARGQLTDPAKFHAYIAKLETAYGQPFAATMFDTVSYQHITLGKSGLQLIVAAHAKTYTLAILPGNASQQQLGEALGITQPQHSIASTRRLAKLAQTEGYGPYFVGYFDTTQLPALIAGAHDPLLSALVTAAGGTAAQAKVAKDFPASCQSDLARIAARIPIVSFGYTQVSSQGVTTQMDVALAPDIVKAFRDIGTHVPGLGKPSNAPLDFALALPMPMLRDFGLAQAEAVQSHPFTCPALTGLNKTFASLQTVLPKAGIPPIGGLRGLHVVTDKIVTSAPTNNSIHQMPDVDARLLVASANPTGLLNLAKAFIPGAAQLDVTDNGKPVALPAALTAKAGHGKPMWLAMSKQALALGIGAGEDAKLASMVTAATGPTGSLMSMHMSGATYAQWMQSSAGAYQKYLARAQAASGKTLTPQQLQAQQRVQASMSMGLKSLDQIRDMSVMARFDHAGLRITSTIHWKH